MFNKIKELQKQLIDAKKSLDASIKESKALNKENKALLANIEAAKSRNGVLLLEDLNEKTIEKLQALEDDQTVIIFTKNDGSRIEIRHSDTSYSNDGFIR